MVSLPLRLVPIKARLCLNTVKSPFQCLSLRVQKRQFVTFKLKIFCDQGHMAAQPT